MLVTDKPYYLWCDEGFDPIDAEENICHHIPAEPHDIKVFFWSEELEGYSSVRLELVTTIAATEAPIAGEIVNEAWIYVDTYTWAKDEDQTCFGDFELYKINAFTKAPLGEVEFEVWPAIQVDPENPGSGWIIDPILEEPVMTVSTDDEGVARGYLHCGHYFLVEINPPAGYHPPNYGDYPGIPFQIEANYAYDCPEDYSLFFSTEGMF
ncbi:MAG: SpaA isopeptide-forming pilin-related protein, partial [Promicromonosporaceae bacterium]|nr:SpaA isopeptide-forming pilin-related protein [Promicromonosporaceae bacterium]